MQHMLVLFNLIKQQNEYYYPLIVYFFTLIE